MLASSFQPLHRTPSIQDEESTKFYEQLASVLSPGTRDLTSDEDSAITGTIHRNYVLCGRDSQNYRHPGNQRFRRIIATHHGRYQKAKTEKDKWRVADEVVVFIGRKFLMQDADRDESWHILEPDKVHRKVSHALRNAKEHAKSTPSGRHTTSTSVLAQDNDTEVSLSDMIDVNIDEIDPLNFDLGQTFGMSVVDAIEHDDVLLGRKGISYKHPGNMRFRTIIRAYGQQYQSAKSHAAKYHIVSEVVTMVGARFIERRPNLASTVFCQVGSDQVHRKVSHALRNHRSKQKGCNAT